MIFIRKTILILSIVFAVFYVWFNFDYVMFESTSLLGLASGPAIDPDSLIDLRGSANLYPLSADKKFIGQNIEIIPEINMNRSFSISIPSLGVSAPIVLEPTINQDRIYKQLEKGVVHYAETPLPGQRGTSIIIGHSSVYPWYAGKYGQVFASLSKLQTGDIIQVENNGDVLSYKVTRSIIFSPGSPDDFALKSLEYSDNSSIVLMTCWPTGTNSKRVAVRADLVI